MVGRYEGGVDLSAIRAKRHYRRPSAAVLFAQGRRDYRCNLLVLGNNQLQRIIEGSAHVYLARPHQLILDIHRFEESGEEPDHVGGKAIVAVAERIGDL